MTVLKRRYGSTWRVLSPIIGGGEEPDPTAPMPPTSVQASSSIGDQATVSWTPPADNGGSSLTGYVITTTRVSDSTSTETNVGSGTISTVITDLIAGELYEFTVRAVNAIGSSSESQPPVQVLTPGGSTLVMPIAATVGPRVAPNRTISAAQALTELRNTGQLSQTTVTGTFGLAGSDGIGWVIEDCRFEGGSTYAVRGYTTGGTFTGTQAQRPVFRYCEILGAAAHSGGSDTGAGIYGDDMIFDHVDIYGSVDGIKARSRLEVRHSWVHDLDHPSGAHSDAVQIVSGTNSVFIGNRFDAYVAYSSDGSLVPTGDTGSGMLQTGSVTGNISALWDHNWFAGGHYTIRGVGNDARVEYTFTNNRFLRYGTSVTLGLTNLPPNRYGTTYDGVTTNEVWENNVWDDTEELVA